MVEGFVVGIVKDNVDPEKMNRVLVELPVESFEQSTETFWCRVATPMAGNNRGLVIIPEIGTEVVLSFAYKSLTPYVVGAVYNGTDDKPEVYHNDDEKNNKRVFWSRNDHMVIFDDTEGEEKFEIGAQASTRLDVSSAPIYQSLDSSKKTITEYCDGNTNWEAKKNISIKCKDFELEASNNVSSDSDSTTAIKSGGGYQVKADGNNENIGNEIHVNSGFSASPQAALSLPEYKHPPTKPD